MLSYEIERGNLIVKLTGELDHSAAIAIKREVDELLSDKRIKRLIFDMNGLSFMDSSGIGLIIGRYKNISKRGGSVAVKRAAGRIDKLLEMAGLYQIIEKLA